MPRIRSIKPDFFLDDEIAALPALARLLYIGLWTQADRAGRLKDKPVRIKAAVLPYDECDVDALLDSLQEAGLIVRYAVHEDYCIAIRNFDKHQVFNNERASQLPAPPAETLSTGEHYSSDTVALHQGKEGKGKEGKGRNARAREEHDDGDFPASPPLANLPECLTETEFQGRPLSAALVDALAKEVFGPTWTMKAANIGKIGAAIREGCPPACDHSCATDCASAFHAIAAKHGPEKAGLVIHAIANDPRPWAERSPR